ncbi:MAG TPA: VTT domain-containing protein [Rhabdochlamydiaceae bacterium]|nr:VTT domain-containing protein [Rhabdochlamydiaceae bacterium]
MKFKFKHLIQYIPLAVLITLIIIFYATGLYHYVSYHFLKAQHDQLMALVHQHHILAPIIFMLAYAFTMSLGIPDVLFFTLAGGFLFPWPLSLVYVVFSETIGSSLFFLSVRTAFGSKIYKKKYFLFLNKMKKGFQKYPASYLLSLRFMHIIPIWMVNLAAGLSNVRLWTFVWTTFLGYIPLAVVFTQMGSGLHEIFAHHEKFSVRNVLNYKIEISLGLLALISLAPILVKKYIQKKRRKK